MASHIIKSETAKQPVRFFRDEKHILVFFLEDEMETKFFLRETSFPNFFQLIIKKMVV